MKFNIVMGLLWILSGVATIELSIYRSKEYLMLYALVGIIAILTGGVYIGRHVEESQRLRESKDPSS